MMILLAPIAKHNCVLFVPAIDHCLGALSDEFMLTEQFLYGTKNQKGCQHCHHMLEAYKRSLLAARNYHPVFLIQCFNDRHSRI